MGAASDRFRLLDAFHQAALRIEPFEVGRAGMLVVIAAHGGCPRGNCFGRSGCRLCPLLGSLRVGLVLLRGSGERYDPVPFRMVAPAPPATRRCLRGSLSPATAHFNRIRNSQFGRDQNNAASQGISY